MSVRIRLMVLCLVLISACGCGPSVGQLAGQVTTKGEPVVGAELKFVSAANEQHEFFGTSSEGGTYSLTYRESRGLPVGKYQVTITHTTRLDGKPLPPDEDGATLRANGQVRESAYTFDVEIIAGKNALDFDLSKGQLVKPTKSSK